MWRCNSTAVPFHSMLHTLRRVIEQWTIDGLVWWWTAKHPSSCSLTPLPQQHRRRKYDGKAHMQRQGPDTVMGKTDSVWGRFNLLSIKNGLGWWEPRTELETSPHPSFFLISASLLLSLTNGLSSGQNWVHFGAVSIMMAAPSVFSWQPPLHSPSIKALPCLLNTVMLILMQ